MLYCCVDVVSVPLDEMLLSKTLLGVVYVKHELLVSVEESSSVRCEFVFNFEVDFWLRSQSQLS